jgi:hypothetical protein
MFYEEDDFSEEISEFVRDIDNWNDNVIPLDNIYKQFWFIESEVIKFREQLNNYNDFITENSEDLS